MFSFLFDIALKFILALSIHIVKLLSYIKRKPGNHVIWEETHLNQRVVMETILLSCLRLVCHVLSTDSPLELI